MMIWRLTFCILLGVAGLIRATDGAVSYDVIPRSWISGTGDDCAHELTGKDTAIILPSYPGARTERGASVDCPHLLTKSNRISPNPTNYRPPASIRKAMIGGENAVITIVRGDQDDGETTAKEVRENRISERLLIEADAETVTAIRSLTWPKFRGLQQDFAGWLVLQNKPKYLFDGLKKPVDGFNDLEKALREFWEDTLKTATFDKFFAQKQADYFGKSLVRVPNVTRSGPDGLRTGAIPLPRGARLAIHWGGTANYGYQTANITRPTPTGTLYLDVKSLITDDWAFRLAAVTPESLPKLLPTAPVFTELPKALPYGADNALLDRVIPIYNEFDLHNAEIFPPPTGSQPSELILLIPASYTKADANTAAGDALTYSTHEASSRERLYGNESIEDSLYRRFAIWGSDEAIERQADLDGKDFAIAQKQSHKTLLFGNQTWIDVELPVSLNGTTHWVEPAVHFRSFLLRTAPILLLSAARQEVREPLFEFIRAHPTRGRETFDQRDALQFRFWTPPGGVFESIELLPYDSFIFRQ